MYGAFIERKKKYFFIVTFLLKAQLCREKIEKKLLLNDKITLIFVKKNGKKLQKLIFT